MQNSWVEKLKYYFYIIVWDFRLVNQGQFSQFSFFTLMLLAVSFPRHHKSQLWFRYLFLPNINTLKASATLTPSLSLFYWIVSVLIMAGLRSLASLHTDTRAECKQCWSRVKTDVAAGWAIFNSGDWGRVTGQHLGLKGQRGKVKEIACRSLDLFAVTRFWAFYSEETKVDKCNGSTFKRTA